MLTAMSNETLPFRGYDLTQCFEKEQTQCGSIQNKTYHDVCQCIDRTPLPPPNPPLTPFDSYEYDWDNDDGDLVLSSGQTVASPYVPPHPPPRPPPMSPSPSEPPLPSLPPFSPPVFDSQLQIVYIVSIASSLLGVVVMFISNKVLSLKSSFDSDFQS